MEDITKDLTHMKTIVVTNIKHGCNETYKFLKLNSLVIFAYFFGLIVLSIALYVLDKFYYFIPIIWYMMFKYDYVVIKFGDGFWNIISPIKQKKKRDNS